MEVTFLGAGDMFSYNQGHNSVLLEFEDTNLMIDFPESNWKGLRELGKDLTDIEHIFITHLHEDHINGLQLLGNYCRVHSNRKPKLYISKYLSGPLWDTLRAGMEYTSAGQKSLNDYFKLYLVDQFFYVQNTKFELIKTNHIPGMISHGLLVEPYFYFSGDTTLDELFLTEIHNNVDIIFHECHLQNDTLKSHTSLDEILNLPNDVKGKMILMHYHDEYSSAIARQKLEAETHIRIAGPLSKYQF